MKVLKYTTGQSPSNTPSAKSQGDRFQTRPSTLVGQQPICRMTRKTLLQKIYWTSAGLATLVIAFIVSVTFLNPSSVGNTAFVANINLWAFIWAVNFLLFLILCFILARDLTRIYFEYRSKKPGRRIKTKLIITFTLFSLFPAVLMSFLAFGLINSNLQLWFTSPSEQLLESALALPALDYCLKCSHVFNVLDASGSIGVTERTAYILRVRKLAVAIAKAHAMTGVDGTNDNAA